MRTQNAPLIRLKNYKAPDYLIETVHLTFELAAETTKVRSVLQVKRNKGVAKDAPLVLDGDELELSGCLLNGKEPKDFSATPDSLIIRSVPKAARFELVVETVIAPASNTKLMGLYQSNGVYCTQCEAEGFRRITYFPDRPDVLAVYTVRIEADRDECPLLLSNGNPGKKGRLSKNRHFAEWHDPHPKPSYLFALVGGPLDALSDRFKTASGKKVALNIYVEKGKSEQARYAMGALKRSMVWDEQVYGREYDLDVFNIVAVSDFNMGAMENKGLNVFNDKYVLADPTTATDQDYMHIEAIIAHEYFHNWTGNRITCRDWFQLCLKEGLTVYRDQEFSADLRSRPVQRIQQVRGLKAGQFPEDASPLAHPVRPSAYKEINNFYTATVYQKGAELVRMLATLVGERDFRRATDLYFKRHDGEAAVVEDFLRCFEDVSNQDLSGFRRWYEQAGTPTVEISEVHDKGAQRYTLKLEQSISPTPGQASKKAVPIPLRFGFLTKDGAEIPIQSRSKNLNDDTLVLRRKGQSFVFENIAEKPVLSIGRGFTAPVNFDHREPKSSILTRARFDPDAYKKWEALNSLLVQAVVKGTKSKKDDASDWADPQIVEVVCEASFDERLEPAFRAQLLSVPSVGDVVRNIGKNVNPDAILAAHTKLSAAVGKALGAKGLQLVQSLSRHDESDVENQQLAGDRALKNAMLPLLIVAGTQGAIHFAQTQFSRSELMTDKMAALLALTHGGAPKAICEAALDEFYQTFVGNPLVVDKWFSLQASIPGSATLARVKKLLKHRDFSLRNPNRARSLLAPFASNNPTAFHQEDGAGYAMFAEQILALDDINPQIAARLLTLMNNWKVFDSKRRAAAKTHLKRIAEYPTLSRDTKEIVEKFLS
ncbi:MAG: aminopeptidase N [Pseudomonadota bacterium]